LGSPRRPPWASGKIVPDYGPLYAYWRIARSLGREELVEDATLKPEDFDALRRIVEEGVSNVLELLERLTDLFEPRVDEEVAEKAFEEEGMPFRGVEARRRMASILAGWLVEAGEYWRILRLRLSWGGSWPP
jgi:hypothetical protein